MGWSQMFHGQMDMCTTQTHDTQYKPENNNLSRYATLHVAFILCQGTRSLLPHYL